MCGFGVPSRSKHTGKNGACTTKSLFVCAPRRFFASVGQTIGFGRLPCHGQKPKKNDGLTGLTIRVCGEAALCQQHGPDGGSAETVSTFNHSYIYPCSNIRTGF